MAGRALCRRPLSEITSSVYVVARRVCERFGAKAIWDSWPRYRVVSGVGDS